MKVNLELRTTNSERLNVNPANDFFIRATKVARSATTVLSSQF